MRTFSVSLALIFITLFLGCESLTVSPAPMAAEVIRAGAGMQVDEQTLRDGRRLFVSRCIQCHTIPIVWYYAKRDWPEIVRSMADRASLKPVEEKAIVAYICAVRAQ